MAKKKNYVPRKDDDWNEEEAKEHRNIIRTKEKLIAKKYKQWWDSDNNKWRKEFNDK